MPHGQIQAQQHEQRPTRPVRSQRTRASGFDGTFGRISLYEPQQSVVLLARTQDHRRFAGQMGIVSCVSIPSTRRLFTYAPPWVIVRRASPLLFASPDFDQGVDDRQAFARELLARQLPAGNVGEDAGQLGVAQVADFGAEEDFGRPLGRAKSLGPMNQSRQLGGQAAAGPHAGPDRPDARPAARRFRPAARSVKNRRQRPTSASSRLIQY